MQSVDDIETELLLEAIYKRYGHDFRSYAKASIKRRIREYLIESSENTCCQLIEKILYDETEFRSFIAKIAVNVTEMFRDADFYIDFKKKVIPILRTYPYIKIWHAGCSSGEEVYSLAIILEEEDLLNRAVIYATDSNQQVLEIAKQGVYAKKKRANFEKNYLAVSNSGNFSDYYSQSRNDFTIHSRLRSRVTFFQHYLNMDGPFGEMNVILCRNVMIYFNRDLQNRVLNLFGQSFVHFGLLCLGVKENLSSLESENEYKVISNIAKIYQRKS